MVVWAQTNDGRFDIVSITPELLDGAMDVMRKSFFIQENVSIAVELHKHPNAIKELEELCLRAGRDGVSLAAVERATGKIVCAAFNKIQVPAEEGEPNYFENYEANCKEPSAKSLVRFMIDADAAFDLFDNYKVDCLVEVMFIATLPEYKGLGLSTQVFLSTIDLSRKLLAGENVKVSITDKQLTLQPVPKLVSAICTSFITVKIAKRLKFDVVNEIPYTQFSFNGKTYADRIEKESPSSVLVALKL